MVVEIENEKNSIIKAPIVEAMNRAYKNPTYQFHIPGHTKGLGIYPPFTKLVGSKVLSLDTTDEFDNLGTLTPATGPIKEAEELAARAFGAKRTFFLINGSTIGNLAIAMGLTKKGQKIIVNRNCHRSILTGLIISGADPLWVIPEKLESWGIWGYIDPSSIENLLENNSDVACVWVTNPTYEGVVSNINEISKVCKKYNVPLIVDEAHGCLWNFSEELPTSSLKLGADIVVHSLHKTGGSMSQSSMLHINKTSTINTEDIERALMLLHTTSPSLLLLASLDAARAHLETPVGHQQLKSAISNAKYLRNEIDKMNSIHHFKFANNENTDVTKIFIKADNLSGKRLEYILEIDFGIEVESASDIGILILSNIGNTCKDFEYLAQCLHKIDNHDYKDVGYNENKKHMPMLTPIIKKNLREAFYSEKEIIPTSKAVGRLSGEVVAECPPGISILLPGELITKEHLPYLTNYESIEVLKK